MIELKEVHKSFRIGFWMKRAKAVEGVSFKVNRGESFGIIGANGAGKTTTIKMITGLIEPDRGEVSISDKSPQEREARKLMGYLPENPYFYEHLRVEELLVFYGKMFGLGRDVLNQRVPELVKLVGLENAAGKTLKKYSKGMRQRAGIAQALINDPEILILDEPQSGLDPLGRKDVRDLLLRLKERGKTIVFSSHILHDIEEICDRVAVFSEGKVVGIRSLNEALQPRGFEVMYRASAALVGVESKAKGPHLFLTHVLEESELFPLLERLRASDAMLYQVNPIRPDLESIVVNEIKSGTK